MAQGFIQSTDTGRHLEDIGEDYFQDLVSGNFFQDLQEDDLGNVYSCKMHDLMHDVARLVAGDECVSFGENAESTSSARTLHVSCESVEDLPKVLPICLNQAKKLRTVIPLYRPSTSIAPMVCLKDIARLEGMRVLKLNYANISMVPSSIGNLKHLRELDLSFNPIDTLPSSIIKLQNLQTLILSKCQELKELPRDIRKLVKLRHLDLSRCTSLSYLPSGLGELTSLHTLSYFVVSNDHSTRKYHAQLNELNSLDNLRGYLRISNLGYKKEDVLEYKGLSLTKKGGLQSLVLEWERVGTLDSAEEAFNNHEAMLDGLQPHPNLRWLCLMHNMSARLPQWIMDDMISSVPNLVEISFWDCRNLQHLPPLGLLPHLKSLKLALLFMVDCIDNNNSNVLGNDDVSTRGTTPDTIVRQEEDHQTMLQKSFPRLSQLSIVNCPKLTSLPILPQLERLTLYDVNEGIRHGFVEKLSLNRLTIGGMKTLEIVPNEWLHGLVSLSRMTIARCPKLTCLSHGMQNLNKLRQLIIRECDQLDLSVDENGNALQFQALTSLRYLTIYGIPKLISLPEWLLHLTNLEVLHLSNLSNLVALPGWIGDLLSLRTLEIVQCGSLTALPEEISKLKSLECVRIAGCPRLEEACLKDTGTDWPKIAHLQIHFKELAHLDETDISIKIMYVFLIPLHSVKLLLVFHFLNL
ncbi:hypothetical protein CDL15_Pgr016017 [Punica granatum]|uniref:Disease resistance protein RGA4 n=1 Tax=Punica granatum TaxID=22663 RepID=A0A218XQ72_PUNGR|nr:hypothetical protein CDL15_Pgr016017 [Punica granatum]